MEIPNLRKDKTSKIRVGVLRGGPSGEYEVSLKTGSFILENLPQNKYYPVDIYIDQNGKWHWHGMICEPYKILKHVDVVFNGLHGDYGEDGKVQRLLENFGIPFTGSKSVSSAMAMNKVFTKKIFEKEGLRTPEHRVLKKEDVNYLKIFETFTYMPKPMVVKPSSSGSSLGVRIVDNLIEMTDAINEALEYSPAVIIEKFIKGKEITCGVVEGLSSLPPIEIKPEGDKFFDYKAKYDGSTKEICPAQLPPKLIELIQELSLDAHRALGLRHYSRTDMILGENGGIYLLEVNTLPGLTTESLLPKSIKASGYGHGEFINHIITLAMNKNPTTEKNSFSRML